MLDFGFSEILLTSAIALVVLGPERLPKVARQVGNWMGRARVMARQLSEQLEREVSAEELLREHKTTPTALPAYPAASTYPAATATGSTAVGADASISGDASVGAAPPSGADVPPPAPPRDTSVAAMHPELRDTSEQQRSR